MRKHIFGLTLIFFTLYCFGQNKSDSIKYVNAIKFIQQDKSVGKYRDKYYFKKANKFKVSYHTVFNYYPLRFLDKYLDSLGFNKSVVDSLCEIPKDTSTIIPFATKLSVDSKSDYILYFGKPFKNSLLVVIKDAHAVGGNKKDTEYNGVGYRPFIILLTFNKCDKVRKAYCSAPIIE